MLRSQINELYLEASKVFRETGWILPPSPKWDITDFGLNLIDEYGLVLINLAEEAEYCEKLMYARLGMKTPAHTHIIKKEDIICRSGLIKIKVWANERLGKEAVTIKLNGQLVKVEGGGELLLNAGSRITLLPGQYHEFQPSAHSTVIGEVSTANNDKTDNIFIDKNIGRFSTIKEDAEPIVKLVSE